MNNKIPDFVSYYNPIFNDGTNEPVTELCYKIAGRKQDLWFAVVGRIPDFYFEFKKNISIWQ